MTARRCAIRPNSSPATIQLPTSPTSRIPPPQTAPTPSRQAIRRYDNSHAASDIERLRNLWDVPAVALVGIGNGAQVALAYAGSRPDKVARLILDSPIALGINAEAAAEQKVKGQQAALDAFAAQCVAVNCALGPDPKGAVTALLADGPCRQGARRRVGGRRWPTPSPPLWASPTAAASTPPRTWPTRSRPPAPATPTSCPA